VEAIN
jgi:hypothetical protein